MELGSLAGEEVLLLFYCNVWLNGGWVGLVTRWTWVR